jgi:hypothetical protein
VNLLTFSNTRNPPKTNWWGVRSVLLDTDTIPLPAPEGYGRIVGGDEAHIDEVNYSFDGVAGDVTLFYQAWDVDSDEEVEVLVNGDWVGFAPMTPNATWGSTQAIVLPDGYVNDSSVNLLTFSNTRNPPKTNYWGVKNVLPLIDTIPIPAPEAYGRVLGGDESHINEVNYNFDGTGGDVTLSYQVWDVDSSTEVEILVNGDSVGFAPITPNASWGSTQAIVLPDDSVNDSVANLLTFSNTRNPPKTNYWGVQNVSLE